ncbi:MAG: penicillin-binding protein 1A [Gammaproteobacteria bacterium]|nr:penicillin-binding protein 1A [Gammaproteobacteria bacterium]MDH5628637.1 penicillin-binding protein 1A [Gammaproteobacteria bacterium]
MFKRFAPKLLYLFSLFLTFSAMGFLALYLSVVPGLPDVESIREIRLQTPMRIYANDGQMIAEFGDKRRIPITLDQVPKNFVNALLSTEDQRFYEHSGVDFMGVMRAVINLVTTGTKSQGASTITMLVARNYYLTREKRFSRKITEMFLAWKIESELTKDQILELFLNKIPFGHRAFGLGAASQVYYGTTLDKLTLAQLATLAGIPKGQSIFNPISNPAKARERREHVLGRMLTEGHISREQYEHANAEEIATKRHGSDTTVHAPYLAEMVRLYTVEKYGQESAYNDGMNIFTTINPTLQSYAKQAVMDGLEEYDLRHGYRGAEANYALLDEENNPVSDKQIMQWLDQAVRIPQMQSAIVMSIDEKDNFANIRLETGENVTLALDNLRWARKYVDENHVGEVINKVSQVLNVGDLIRVKQILTPEDPEKNIAEAISYRLSQIPDVAGGFVALNPGNGAIEALVGGYQFELNQYNMVNQARRQLGSNIKPFIYSAAFEKGFTPASMLNDMPIVEEDITAENFWRPKNDSDNYRGPTRLRIALSYSKNIVSIRLMKEIGAKYAKDYLTHIGFPAEHMLPYLSLALGSASFTPLEVVTSYAVLANGGYKVQPWFVDRIEDPNGRIIFQYQPIQVCSECEIIQNKLLEQAIQDQDLESNGAEELSIRQAEENDFSNIPLFPIPRELIAPRVIDERNLFLVTDILKDVIHRGTATRTLANSKSPLLNRNDIAGKTGTTNDAKDAWFSGYNSEHVATVWVGFNDHAKKLGDREFGGRAALPVWQKFMEKALENQREKISTPPPGIVTVRIDAKTGLLANEFTTESIFEMFRSENAPSEYSRQQNLQIKDEEVEDETLF